MDVDVVAQVIEQRRLTSAPVYEFIEMFRPESEAYELLKADPGVRQRFEALVAAVDQLPVSVKMGVWKACHYATGYLWRCCDEIPAELKKLLDLDADVPMTFSGYVFAE